jgi:hypothetical protein
MRIPTSGTARTLSIGLLFVLGVALAGCGSGAASAPGGGQEPAPDAAGGTPERVAGDGQDGGTTSDAYRDDAKIIRTGSLQLQVTDVRLALDAARRTVTDMGGYIAASQQYNDGDHITANVTYRFPVERWEAALDAFRALGDPIAEQTDAAEVTDQIVDLDARIRNLRASETALVRHASEAVKISDLLEIEARLSEVRGQIEQLTAQQKNLEDRAAYATLDITFGTEILAVQEAARQWDPQADVDRAGASLIGFLQALATAGIWFVIVWLPILIGLAVVVGVAFFLARRLGFLRRHRPPMPPAAA